MERSEKRTPVRRSGHRARNARRPARDRRHLHERTRQHVGEDQRPRPSQCLGCAARQLQPVVERVARPSPSIPSTSSTMWCAPRPSARSSAPSRIPPRRTASHRAGDPIVGGLRHASPPQEKWRHGGFVRSESTVDQCGSVRKSMSLDADAPSPARDSTFATEARNACDAGRYRMHRA